MLIKSPHRTLTDQLAERFAERIRSRLLPAGSRLPSVRDCARQQGVSPYTVVAAYDQLLAQGLVEARRQRGFYVRDFAQNMPLAPVGKAQAAIENIVNGTPDPYAYADSAEHREGITAFLAKRPPVF